MTDDEQWIRELHQQDREILFGSETLVITIIQALTGGALFAAFAGADNLQKILGQWQFLAFLTTVDIALILSVLTAYFKHQYKKWDIKARVAKTEEQRVKRSRLTTRNLGAMRNCMFFSVCAVSVALIELPVFAWLQALCPR